MFFEVYARYKMTSLFIGEACKFLNIKNPYILEVGSNGENYFKQLMPCAKIVPNNINVYNMKIIPDNFVQADATDLPFEENSFDFVISSAVLEHVPANKREAFFKETYRVAKFGVYHSFPVDDDFIIQAEKNVSDFHNVFFGKKHKWIEEHFENEHPNQEKICAFLDEKNIDYSVIRHLDIEIWVSMYKLIIQASNASKNYRLSVIDYINNYYENYIFYNDLSKQSLIAGFYMGKSEPSTKRLAEVISRRFTPPPPLEKLELFYQRTLNLISYLTSKDFFDNVEKSILNVEKSILNVEKSILNVEKSILNVEKNFRNKGRGQIIAFCERLFKFQDTVYLYGVTRSLIFWHDTITASFINLNVIVLDTFAKGNLMEGSSKYNNIIQNPQQITLVDKVVVVFPDNRYFEIFDYIKTLKGRAIFYKDIAE